MNQKQYQAVRAHARANGLRSAIANTPTLATAYCLAYAASTPWDLLACRLRDKQFGLPTASLLKVWTPDSVWAAVQEKREARGHYE